MNISDIEYLTYVRLIKDKTQIYCAREWKDKQTGDFNALDASGNQKILNVADVELADEHDHLIFGEVDQCK